MSLLPSRRSFLAGAAAATASAALPGAALAQRRGRGRSVKKGCCFVTREDSPWLDRITALKPSWFYSWGANRPAGVPDGVEFVPMVWGGSSSDKMAERVEKLRPRVDSGEIQWLMGFNEPDQKSQSNMTVEKVLELWPLLMELDVPLLSPGCVHPDRDWMKQFMAGVEKKKLRVDSVAVHSYGGPSAPILMRRLQNVYKMFGRPLWITEFAVGDWKAKSVEENKHSTGSVEAFMRQVLPALERARFVERYAWFSAAPSSRALGTSALVDDEGELTRLGKLYAAW
ncbi:MAG: glycosyl hydrolase [Planctomycetota bacterium]